MDPPWPAGEPRRGVILALEEEGGARGLGESAPLPGFGLETLPSSIAALRLSSKYLLGMPRERYSDAVSDLHRLAPVVASPCARHALDLALHDLMAQGATKSIAGLLGGLHSVDEVPVNGALPRLPREDLVAASLAAVAEGYRTLKLKVGGMAIQEDVARVRAVRDAVGREVRLRIDANRAWSETDATQALRALEDVGLEYCEEPTSDPEALARVKSAVGVPIAVDESVVDLASAERILDRADVLVLKPMAVGGLYPARAIAAMARERGVDVVVTGMLETPVGRRGALHLAASLGPSLYAHGLATGCTPWPEDSTERPAPASRPDVGRILTIGRDDRLPVRMHDWHERNADYGDNLVQEEV
ncbi:MAG TPA: o-succinylbenzoate synthase [Candidatus Eisenbacteria bacterium]|jgi:o-succinylbenzoate synthase|nr:o-succinylbenzoate synthase [Candidatus Eisenbacteria bacterium]